MVVKSEMFQSIPKAFMTYVYQFSLGYNTDFYVILFGMDGASATESRDICYLLLIIYVLDPI